MSKIGIFTYSIYTVGGEQRVVSLLANELSKSHNITLFTMDKNQGGGCGVELSKSIDIKYYHPYKGDIISFIYRVATHLTPRLVYDIFPRMFERAYCHSKYAKLMSEMIGDDYDVVIVTAWQLSVILGMVKKQYNRRFKTIAWEHSSYEAYFEFKYLYMYKNEKLFSDYVKYIDTIVVLNDDYCKQYKDKLGLDSVVIYNPKTFISFEKATLEEKVIFACSRIDNNKGIDLLIEAFKLFIQKQNDWRLVIAGDGPALAKYQSLVMRSNLGNQVEFLRRISNVKEKMLEASIFALPSRFEGFPMSVTEAFEVGLPVVAFDIPAMKPFTDAGGAVVARTFDVNEYASLLLELADSYDKRKELGIKGIEFAKTLETEIIMDKWDGLIKE